MTTDEQVDVPLPNGNGGMRIEHLHPRSTHPERTYDWHNLLGVCGGMSRDSKGERHEHCDRKKGHDPISLSPLGGSPRPEDVLAYHVDHDGVKVSALNTLPESLRRAVENDLDVLGLNVRALCEARFEARKRLGQVLRKADEAGRRNSAIRRLLAGLDQLDRRGRASPFPEMVANYLESKLRAR